MAMAMVRGKLKRSPCVAATDTAMPSVNVGMVVCLRESVCLWTGGKDAPPFPAPALTQCKGARTRKVVQTEREGRQQPTPKNGVEKRDAALVDVDLASIFAPALLHQQAAEIWLRHQGLRVCAMAMAV